MEQLESEGIQGEAGHSSENENQHEGLVNEIIAMFETLEPSLSSECCIYRVPYHIRRVNEEAYTPQVISIGPFHYNSTRLQPKKNHKVRYFKSLMHRAKPEIHLKTLVSSIKLMEGSIRRCYSETIQLSSNDFVKMILVDAGFILELFFREFERKCGESDDPLLVEGWMLSTVWRDLVLFENQLPFFVIEKLFQVAFPFKPGSYLIELAFHFFRELNFQNKSPLSNVKIKHFIDLFRTFMLPPSDRLPEAGNYKVKLLYSATQLNEAGVKLKVSPSKCLLDLKFTNGVLEIPQFPIYDTTEALIRNVIAFELYHYGESIAYITHYYYMFHSLINTTKDMDLLCDKEIVVNYQGDNNAMTSIVNNLHTNIIWVGLNSDYCHLCENLNVFYKDHWHRWKAMLMRDYFSTPWRIASTIAAAILLVLTLIQTVSSIIQVA